MPSKEQWAEVDAVAQEYYSQFEWSGCAGSAWGRLPDEAKFIRVRTARNWLDAIASVATERPIISSQRR